MTRKKKRNSWPNESQGYSYIQTPLENPYNSFNTLREIELYAQSSAIMYSTSVYLPSGGQMSIIISRLHEFWFHVSEQT